MGWQQLRKRVENSAGGESGGLFVKLGDGESITLAVVGEPYEREIHWVAGQGHECEGRGCPHCADGNKPKLRVSMCVYVPADDGYKVLDQGIRFVEQLMDLDEKRPMDDWLYEVTRKGTGMDTRYTIMPEDKIDRATRKAMDNQDPIDLEELYNKMADKRAESSSNPPAGVPF